MYHRIQKADNLIFVVIETNPQVRNHCGDLLFLDCSVPVALRSFPNASSPRKKSCGLVCSLFIEFWSNQYVDILSTYTWTWISIWDGFSFQYVDKPKLHLMSLVHSGVICSAIFFLL